MRFVEVIWDDAQASTDEISSDQAHFAGPARTHTRGWLAAETERGLVVSMDSYPDDPDHWGTHVIIGWGMIVDWYDIEVIDE